jgi:hypothetical protein
MSRELTEIADLAEAQAQPDVAAAVRRCIEIDRPKFLLVATPDSDQITPLTEWVRRRATATEVWIVPLRELAEHPLRAIQADQLIVVLPAGTFLNGATFENIQRTALSRPPGSYAIVFETAENMSGINDSRNFRAGIERLLLPTETSERDSVAKREPWPPILFFCSDSATMQPGEYTDALAKDRDILAEWIALPRSSAMDLQRFQAAQFCDLLDQSEIPNRQPDSNSSEPSWARFREDVTRSRRKLLELVDRAFSALDRELSASYITFSQNILQVVSPILQDRIHRNSGEEGALEQIVWDVCAEECSRWSFKLQGTAQARYNELVQDATTLVDDISWSEFNRAIATSDSPSYPDPLRRVFRFDIQSVVHEATVSGQAHLNSRQSLLKGVLYGGTVGAAASALLPFGLAGILIGGGLCAIGGAVAGRQYDQRDLLGQAVVSANTLCSEATRQQMTDIQQQLHDQVGQHRQRVEFEFQRILDALEKVMQVQTFASPTSPRNDLQDRLASLRERIASCGST